MWVIWENLKNGFSLLCSFILNSSNFQRANCFNRHKSFIRRDLYFESIFACLGFPLIFPLQAAHIKNAQQLNYNPT
jgi:hypothetical protein